MKKKFFGVACILALSGVLTTGQIITNKRNALTNLENANIEALTDNSDWQEILMYLRCWHPKYAYHQSLEVVDTKSGYFKCDAKGNIKIGKQTIPVNLDANVLYEVQYDVKNCKDAKYSCCNQNKVGINISSHRKL